MKRYFLSILLFLAGLMISVGQVSIATFTSNTDPSALLDLNSSDKGFLLPRLTSAQRDVISSPAEGLMVFCTDCETNGAVCVFTNSAWHCFCLTSPLASPTAGIHSASPGMVIWRWNAVAGATGYRWNTIPDYNSATDMGTSLTRNETGLTCGATYNRFVWAYNSCSNSSPTTLSETTPVNPPASPTAGTHIATKTRITWNWHPVAGATGYRWNVENNFSTATDLGLDTTMTEDTLSCERLYFRYLWAYNGCGQSPDNIWPILYKYTLDCFICVEENLIINHVTTGGVAPVNKRVLYSTVDNIYGEESKCWITQNLGASQQADAVSDNTEASAGWYWQFNRKQGYRHDGTTRTPNTTWTSNISEDSDWTIGNDPCALELDTSWRIPTYTEWYNVDQLWTNWYGPWLSGLKLHAAGYLNRTTNGALEDRGTDGDYWSSIQRYNYAGRRLHFDNNSSGFDEFNKAHGCTLRCIRD